MILYQVRFKLTDTKKSIISSLHPNERSSDLVPHSSVSKTLAGAFNLVKNVEEILQVVTEIQFGLFWVVKIDTDKMKLNTWFDSTIVKKFDECNSILEDECWLLSAPTQQAVSCNLTTMQSITYDNSTTSPKGVTEVVANSLEYGISINVKALPLLRELKYMLPSIGFEVKRKTNTTLLYLRSGFNISTATESLRRVIVRSENYKESLSKLPTS